MTRRELLAGVGKVSSGLVLGVAATDQAAGQVHTADRAQAATAPGALPPASVRKLKVMVAGGHPGDPEAGCGGTVARYSDLGHEVVILYMNRGEGFCGTHPLDQCGAVRTAEAEKACAILHARPTFVGQIDGKGVVDEAHYEMFRALYDAERPDVVIAQWPIDRHPDHRALSSLVLDAWLETKQKAAFYYYEVGEDTMAFSASEYVDISAVEARKRSAFYAHTSQGPDRWYQLQEQITRFRGVESGYAQAEGFIRHPQGKGGNLLP